MMSLQEMVRKGYMDASEAAEIAREWREEAEVERVYYNNLSTDYRMRALGLSGHKFRVPDASVPF